MSGPIGPDSSSGAVKSRVWAQISVMILVPLSKALNHNWVVHSALPSRLLVEHTFCYILAGYEWGNPVSAPGEDGILPLVAVNLGRQHKSVKCIPHLEVAIRPCEVGDTQKDHKLPCFILTGNWPAENIVQYFAHCRERC